MVVMTVRKKRLDLPLYNRSTANIPTNNTKARNRNATKFNTKRVDNTVGKRKLNSLIFLKKVLKGAKNNRVRDKVTVARKSGK